MASTSSTPVEIGSQRVVTANWTHEHENLYIDIMVEHVKKGDLTTSTFSKSGWKEIRAEFFSKTQKSYDSKQFRNKFNKLRQRYKNFQKLVDHTGFGWDPVTNNVTAPDQLWEDYLKVNQDAKIFRTRGCPEFPKLCIIYGDTTARGDMAWSINEDLPPSPNNRESEFLDDDLDYIPETQAPEAPTTGIPTLNSQASSHHTQPNTASSRRRKSLTKGDSIVEALSSIAEIAREKYSRTSSSSSRNAAFSIGACMEVLGKLEDIPIEKYMKAVEKLQVKSWRETLMSMSDLHRRWWVEHLD